MSVASLLLGLLEEDGGTGGGGQEDGTPLDYTNLVMFLEAENGNGQTGFPELTAWQSVGGTLANFTLPAGQRSPLFISNTQQGRDGISFQEASSGSGSLRRKLESNNGAFDNYFSGSGAKTISFAARLDDLVNNFNTDNTLVSKGFNDTNGWKLAITPSGAITFSHRRSNGTVWSVTSAGFYAQGDLVLGSVSYDGGNTSGSGAFTLFNGSDFISSGSVTTGSGGSTGQENTANMIIGNVLDTGDNNQNQPFGGPIFGLWMVKPGSTVFDQSFFAQWIP